MSTPSISPPLARRVMLFVPLAALMVNLGQSVLFATMPMLGRQLQFSELQVTSLVSLSALVYFIISPFWGRYSDSIGRKRVILTGLLGYALGTYLFNFIIGLGLAGLLSSLTLYLYLLPYRVAHTSLMAATHPASSAYVADVTSVQERTNGMALMGAAIAIGSVLGPVFVFFARFGLLVPLYMTAGMCIITFLLLCWKLPDYRVSTGTGTGKTVKLGYFDPRYRLLLLVGLVMYTTMSVMQQTLGFYFQDRLGLSSLLAIQYFATANMLSSVAMLFAQLVLVRKFSWQPTQLLLFGLPVVALGYFGLAFGDSLLLFNLSMMVVGLGLGTAGPGYSASASLRVERHEQGALAGIAGSIPGLGFVIGPLLGGMLYQVEISLPYIFAGMLALLLSIFWTVSSRNRENFRIQRLGNDRKTGGSSDIV